MTKAPTATKGFRPAAAEAAGASRRRRRRGGRGELRSSGGGDNRGRDQERSDDVDVRGGAATIGDKPHRAAHRGLPTVSNQVSATASTPAVRPPPIVAIGRFVHEIRTATISTYGSGAQSRPPRWPDWVPTETTHEPAIPSHFEGSTPGVVGCGAEFRLRNPQAPGLTPEVGPEVGRARGRRGPGWVGHQVGWGGGVGHQAVRAGVVRAGVVRRRVRTARWPARQSSVGCRPAAEAWRSTAWVPTFAQGNGVERRPVELRRTIGVVERSADAGGRTRLRLAYGGRRCGADRAGLRPEDLRSDRGYSCARGGRRPDRVERRLGVPDQGRVRRPRGRGRCRRRSRSGSSGSPRSSYWT